MYVLSTTSCTQKRKCCTHMCTAATAGYWLTTCLKNSRCPWFNRDACLEGSSANCSITENDHGIRPNQPLVGTRLVVLTEPRAQPGRCCMTVPSFLATPWDAVAAVAIDCSLLQHRASTYCVDKADILPFVLRVCQHFDAEVEWVHCQILLLDHLFKLSHCSRRAATAVLGR